MSQRRPLILCVLDGWGLDKSSDTNAISLAQTPVMDRLLESGPHSYLQASEGFVGLPAHQMGNSEVGHTALGAGRVVWQDLVRLNTAFDSGEFRENTTLKNFIAKLKTSKGTCHLIGLLSDGGVHSHQSHLEALATYISEQEIPVAFHALLDGRDTPPQNAITYVTRWLHRFEGNPRVSLASLGGRYYAMDRDKRWERTSLAYAALVNGHAPQFEDPLSALNASYAQDITDEFILPTVHEFYPGMQDGDGLLIGNFRADRVRYMLHTLVDREFKEFERSRVVAFAATAGLMSYSKSLDPLCPPLYSPISLINGLGEVLSQKGKTQLRIAETEKYAHVTFFFNGGSETVYPGETRILVPSPKVATYDLQPEMSAPEVTDKLVNAILEQTYDFILVNFANTDMVGHTGVLSATIKAVETVDTCLGRIDAALRQVHGMMLVTADHGNAEQMTDPANGGPHTAHTCNSVPFMGINLPPFVTGLMHGNLTDVAPTILALLGIPKPHEMTGNSLLEIIL